MTASLEIVCPQCGQETIVRREPVYEGFKKVGEKRLCASCGAEVPDDAESAAPVARTIFGEEDRPSGPDIFSDDERQRCCRYCAHYVVNPFTQRCGLHERDVEATDLCFDFQSREEEADEDDTPDESGD